MFTKKHIISTRDFSKAELDFILNRAEELESYAIRGAGQESELLKGKILANLFYEPSTRTRLSFEAAMKRLGGEVVNLSSPEASSAAKGENLVDTIRVVSGYCDIIALRHPKEGASRMAASFSSVPIINAGDGAGQHPTQTLLDLYTIRKENLLDELKIALIGDLKYSRTVHSLAYALSLYGAKLFFVSPDALKMPDEIKMDLKGAGAEIFESTEITDFIKEVNVLYVTRIQRERFPDPAEYNKVAGTYRITTGLIAENEEVVIMHPLPKLDEINADVDQTKNARYFQQAFYGTPIRMAVLSLLLKS
ncbi:aspartate carbamoyltransferase catalytic subunit [Methanophagales archaeon]|nr:aspartate carbamoyltransferase catalytic subunit [Methanophagales archaeon]